MIWSTPFRHTIITAVECKWLKTEHTSVRYAWGDAATTLLEVLSPSFLLFKYYSFNIFCSFNSLCFSLPEFIFLFAGTCYLSVPAGCRPGLEGLCSGELGPKRICKPMCGFVWQQLFSRVWTAKITIPGFSLGMWLKRHGRTTKSLLRGNHEVFLRNVENRWI